MTQLHYRVDNISCGHCTRTIETELSELADVSAVAADKNSKVVTVTLTGTGRAEAVENLLDEIGFPGVRQ